ncbi:hypothetical protein FA95DRAFT_282733 [Auriscalpium vulgare]|uniref:Uncharacterized protein n=1 Tax=Auriscalpium vulgare TaxID=40419 RepID=A0ACB8S607_9AGAM|nr:hypothetical protein FA95DRAFT_282733 [Auriscalpium vulgare]
MEFSPEIYSLVVAFVRSRNDICTLCRVSKGFQRAAERALYNTLHMTVPNKSVALCNLLNDQPRFPPLVSALTISLRGIELSSEDSNDSVDDSTSSLPPDYWECVARALRSTTHLRFLSIYLGTGMDPKVAWILDGCIFQLQMFHCDMAWDDALVSFLSHQHRLSDLHVADFNNEDTTNTVSISHHPLRQAHVLPRLSFLECGFPEVVNILVPRRPVTHVKSCFSRPDVPGKREELALLLNSLRSSSQALRALNIADSSYTDSFSQEFLPRIVSAFAPDPTLRYVGPLVLPVDGRQRLAFYSCLRRLSQLRATELEVSDWEPPPTSFAAMRALASELHMYCPSVNVVVFSRNFESKVLMSVDGLWRMDEETTADLIWREV